MPAAGRGAGDQLVAVDRRDVDLGHPEHRLHDLPGQRGEALAGVDGRADHGGVVAADPHGRGGDLVLALRPEHVHHADRVADAAPHRGRVTRAAGAAGQQPVRVGLVHRQRGQRLGGHRLDQRGDGGGAGDGLSGRHRVTGGEHVAAADLQGLQAQPGGQLVELRLVREAGLQGALAAHPAGRRVVGAHRPGVHEDVRADVGAHREGGGGGQRLRGDVRVGTAVQQDLRLHLDQLALGVRMVTVPQEGRVAAGVGLEGLLAGEGHLHRAPGAQREQRQGDLEGEVLAVGRRAGHAGDHQPDPVRLQAQAGGRAVAVPVRVGGGEVQLDAAVRARHSQARLGADRGRVLPADLVEALDDHLADRLRVAAAQRQVAEEVAVGVQRRRVEGLLGIGQRLQHLVLDHDRGGRQPGGVGVVGGDGGDRLTVVADHLGGQDRTVGDHPAVRRAVRGAALAGRQVGGGDHGVHAGDGEGGRGVDRQDPGVRVRGAQHGAPEQALGPQVRGVRVDPEGLGQRVGPQRGAAEAEGLALLRLLLHRRGGDGRGVGGRRHAWSSSGSRMPWAGVPS